jgi:predicted DCC family thiol-disulfide oxidoreductase YuxK
LTILSVESRVQHETSESIVYFDGSCPLCRAEIGHYRRHDESGALRFVDVSRAGAALPPGLGRQQAMARFHVLAGDGRLLSGAEAFAAVWRRLPRWRWVARAAALPGAMAALELGYRLVLPVRPAIARFYLRLRQFGGPADGAGRR